METTNKQTQQKVTSNPLLEARNEVIYNFSDTTFRMEWIRTFQEIDFINDAKSSSVLMSLAAIEQCNNKLIWIVSDANLVSDLNLVKDIIAQKVKAIIYLAEKPNTTLEQNCKGLVRNVIRLGSLEEAVQASLSFAQSGDGVLFSPAAPSYLKLQSIQQRGTLFNQIVQKL